MRFNVNKRARRVRRLAGGILGGALVFQAGSCQTTPEDIIVQFISAATTSAINSFVFDQFNLSGP